MNTSDGKSALWGGVKPGTNTLFLVSCVSKKRSTAAPARDLYSSTWFVKARRFVEFTGSPWFILSAEYGLVDPGAVVAPYERTLNAMGVGDRRSWASCVLGQLEPRLAGFERIVVLAGERYREFLVPALESRCEVVIPLQGLGIGEQLGWFTERERERAQP